MRVLHFALVSTFLILGLPAVEPQNNSCTLIDQVTHVQVFEVLTQLVVVWHEPLLSESCRGGNLEYSITYTSNNITQAVVTDNLNYYFEYTPNPCIDNVISITAFVGQVNSKPFKTVYNTKLGVVSNIIANHKNGSLQVYWNPPLEALGCNLNYSVQLHFADDNVVAYDVVNKLTLNIPSVDIRSCQKLKVEVIAVRGRSSGKSASTQVEGDIGPVRNIKVSLVNEEIVTFFDEPENSEQCSDLSYEIVQGESICYVRNISIAPISLSGKAGVNKSAQIEHTIGKVQNLTSSPSSTYVYLLWVPPQNSAGCGVKYLVNFNNRNYSTTSTSYTISSTVPSICQRGMFATVYTVSRSGLFGSSEEVEVQRGLGSVISLSLSRSKELVTAYWNPPSGSTNYCVLSYLISYTVNNVTNMHVTPNTSFKFYADDCAAINIEVETRSNNDVVGTIASRSLAGC